MNLIIMRLGRRAMLLAFALGTLALQVGLVPANETRAIEIAGAWRHQPGIVTHGEDGKVIFLFGETQPSVVCSPLQVCDIELQPGETINDVMVGDSVRWKVEPATSGSAEGQAVHLILKPSEPGLQTSMVVTTSRRTYHIQLLSHPIEYMARVGFDYPEDIAIELNAINARLEASIIPGAGVSAEHLDFGFRLEGDARWKPTRIYTDGVKTYIQFPASITGTDAPVLFVMSGGENRIVNYRLNGTMMIIDYLVDQAILVSGVGKHQQKITIRRGN